MGSPERHRRGMAALLPSALLGLVACATTPVHERSWWLADVGGVEILTDWDRERAERLVEGLSWFRALAAEVAGIAVEPVDRSASLVVFASESDFLRFAHSGDIGGFVAPTLNGMRGAVDGSLPAQYVFEIACHEYVHIAMESAEGPRSPGWYEEGLAEYLSEIRLEGDALVLGAGSRLGRKWVGAAHSVSIAQLIESDLASPVYRDLRDHQDYHGSAAAFVAWLHVEGAVERRAQLERYLALWSESGQAAPSFRAAFGATPEEIEARMLREESEASLSRRLSRSGISRPRVSLRAADRDALLALLAEHALPSPAARAWLAPQVEAARAAAPGDVSLALRLADLAQAAGDSERALALVRGVLEQRPDDPAAHARLGDHWLAQALRCDSGVSSSESDVAGAEARAPSSESAVASAACAEAAERAVLHYERALALDPLHARAVRGVGIALWRRDGDPMESLVQLDRAARLYKSDPVILMAQSEVLAAAGDRVSAEAALLHAHALLPEGRERTAIERRLAELRQGDAPQPKP